MNNLTLARVIDVYPDRYSVRLESVRYGVGRWDDVPVCAWGAGSGKNLGGSHDLPQKGDVVLVGFLGGLSNVPIVILPVKMGFNARPLQPLKSPTDFHYQHPNGLYLTFLDLQKQVVIGDSADGATPAHGILVDFASKSVRILGDAKVVCQAKNVYLGDDQATEPVPLGQKLLDLLKNWYVFLTTHVHPTGVGPSGPATSPSASQPDGTLLSQVSFTE